MNRLLLISVLSVAAVLAPGDARCASSRPTGPAYGEVVNGIKVTLEVIPTDWQPNSKVQFICTAMNTTKEPVHVAAWGLDLGEALEVRGGDGQVIVSENMREETARVPRSAIETIAPGESHRFVLDGKVTRGNVLVVNELLGGVWQWSLAPGSVTVRAVFERSENDPWAKKLLRTGYWTGKAVSPSVRAVLGDTPLEPGVAVGGLRLRLNAENSDLVMNSVANRLGEYDVKPTKLEFTFINEGDAPLKVNTRNLFSGLLRLDIEGPDAESVRVAPVDATKPGGEGASPDSVAIDPDMGWSCDYQPEFPGSIGATGYLLMKPGQYRITAIYKCEGKDFWSGATQSNEVVLNVVGGPGPPGTPVKGLKLELATDQEFIALGGEPAKLSLTFVNLGKTPIKLNAYDFDWQRMKMEVHGPDGKLFPPTPVLIERLPPAQPTQDDFPTIEPGKSWTYKWKPRFPGAIGGLAYEGLKPGAYVLKVAYEYEPPPEGAEYQEFIKDCWTGILSSNEITITVVDEHKK